MKDSAKKVMHWIPVLLSAIFAGFIGLFALDILMEDYTCKEMMTGFLVHFRLVYILVTITLIAWRWRVIGGLAFLAIALHYTYTMYGKFPIITYMAIAGPLFLIGMLFLVNKLIAWRYSEKEENRVAFWTLVAVTSMFILSEIVIFNNTREFSLVYAGILVLITVAAFLYRVKPQAETEKKRP